jgi:hypothetical protein
MSWIFPKDKNGERRFGCWAVNPKGEAENPLNCIAEVKGVGWLSKQCGRRRGHGRNGTLCYHHAHSFRFNSQEGSNGKRRQSRNHGALCGKF